MIEATVIWDNGSTGRVECDRIEIGGMEFRRCCDCGLAQSILGDMMRCARGHLVKGCGGCCYGLPKEAVHNARALGDTRITKDGFVEVKIKDGLQEKPNENWEFLHRIVWEEANGPVPDGCCIVHVNRDKADNRLENLRCITRGEHAVMVRHGYTYCDAASFETALLAARVAIKRAEIGKKTKKGEQ